MSDIESNSSTNPTVPNVPIFPIYLDKDPIIWDENKATIPGVQHAIRGWFKRTGKYKTLFTNRTAPCGHGKLAIDHPCFEIVVPFVRTDDNLADFFTKPLSATKFHAMRRHIMNLPADDAPAAPSAARSGAAAGAAPAADADPRGGVAGRSGDGRARDRVASSGVAGYARSACGR